MKYTKRLRRQKIRFLAMGMLNIHFTKKSQKITYHFGKNFVDSPKKEKATKPAPPARASNPPVARLFVTPLVASSKA